MKAIAVGGEGSGPNCAWNASASREYTSTRRRASVAAAHWPSEETQTFSTAGKVGPSLVASMASVTSPSPPRGIKPPFGGRIVWTPSGPSSASASMGTACKTPAKVPSSRSRESAVNVIHADGSVPGGSAMRRILGAPPSGCTRRRYSRGSESDAASHWPSGERTAVKRLRPMSLGFRRSSCNGSVMVPFPRELGMSASAAAAAPALPAWAALMAPEFAAAAVAAAAAAAAAARVGAVTAAVAAASSAGGSCHTRSSQLS
eukprot:scaffold160148_cov31-Tisochrysis_lutea.AAC.2